MSSIVAPPPPTKKGLFAKFGQSPPTLNHFSSSTNTTPTPTPTLSSFPRVNAASSDILKENAALLAKTTALESQLEHAKQISDINRSMLNKCSSELIEKSLAHEQSIASKDTQLVTLQEQLDASENTRKAKDQVLAAKGQEIDELRKTNERLAGRAERAEEVVRTNVEVIGTLKEQMRGEIARQILKEKKFVEEFCGSAEIYVLY